MSQRHELICSILRGPLVDSLTIKGTTANETAKLSGALLERDVPSDLTIAMVAQLHSQAFARNVCMVADEIMNELEG